MKDLTESSRLFEASTRLQSAATALGKIQIGLSISEIDRENLSWAGQFLSEVDSTSNQGQLGGVSGDLAVQATDVRPSFYAALINVEAALKDDGLSASSDLQSFLSETYEFLLSAGTSLKSESGSGIHLAQILLDELANSLLIQLTGNGVPSETESPFLLTA